MGWDPKRLVVGRAIRSDRLDDTLLPKSLALPVFCSDPLSSVAYATDEILLVLALGGTAALARASWAAAAVVALLVIVVASYRQTCHAYPNGGGAYAVSHANLGERAALVAASALLVDYVLTVAVSVVAGVANIVSAFPSLAPHAVGISVGMIVLLAVMNLRGVKESGTAFAVPTYGFVLVIGLLLVAGFWKASTVGLTAESAHLALPATHTTTGALGLLLLLRAFSSGCTALTGVEAVSNGVPHFRPPKSRNAGQTLVIMGGLAISMFVGVTALALTSHVHLDPSRTDQRTVVGQLGAAVFGSHSVLFFLVQGFTAAVLVMAANTAFNGFPILASILARDGFVPKQFSRRGDRLAFSNGIVVLALVASALVVAFNAETTRLIQLYIIGVFVSFTLSQAGMVRHWGRLLVDAPPAKRASLVRRRIVNAVGAVATAVVLVVVLATKFVHGAWIVVIAMPVVYLTMLAVRRHYDRVAIALTPPPGGITLPSRIHALVLVSKLHTPTLRALSFARATRPSTLTAVTVAVDANDTAQLMRDWATRDIPVPLTVLASAYRDVTRPVLEHVMSMRRESPRDIVSVFIPEYVVSRWWQQLLHNQSALRLKARLLFMPGVMVTSVPAHLDGSDSLLQPEVQQLQGV